MGMKLISWNVNGLRSVIKKDVFHPFVAKEKPDILCLQEIKALEAQIPPELKNIPGYQAYWNPAEPAVLAQPSPFSAGGVSAPSI